MKNWFKSLNKTLRGVVCISPLAVGGALIVLYAWCEKLFLLLLGIGFVVVSVLFLALNGKVVKEEKFQLTETEQKEHERKLAESERKGEADAALIDENDLSNAIEELQKLSDQKEIDYNRTTDAESRMAASYDLMYTNAKLRAAIKRKMKILRPDLHPSATPQADAPIEPAASKQTEIETVTVIDFETANHSFTSACSIGIAVIKGLEIVDKKYFLIQPPDNFYTNDNIAIHHITPADTQNADTFPAVWEKIKTYFSDTYLAAHNANFDMSVLKATLDYYHIEQPDFQFVNTIGVSSYGIPRPSDVGKSLDARCAYFGIPLDNHHNALCDAVAAAQLIICNAKLSRWKSVTSFLRANSSYFFNYIDVKLKTDQSFVRYHKVDVNEIAATTAVNEETDADFKGKTFVITGEFKTITREQALRIIVERGGKIKGAVSKQVDVLINADDRTSTKTQRAAALQAAGHQIRIVSEEQFLRMLESNDAIDWEE